MGTLTMKKLHRRSTIRNDITESLLWGLLSLVFLFVLLAALGLLVNLCDPAAPIFSTPHPAWQTMPPIDRST